VTLFPTCGRAGIVLSQKMYVEFYSLVISYCFSWLVLLSVRAVLTNGSFLGYCQYGSVLPNLAAVCASIYHTIHTISLTLTLNLIIISS